MYTRMPLMDKNAEGKKVTTEKQDSYAKFTIHTFQ